MAELPRAAFLPDRTVRVAAALLPAAARDRYEREYLSELFGLKTWAQTRYALDVLLHTAHLRIATRRQGTPQELTMTDTPHPPLTCRLHLHHRWVTQRTTDGGEYQQCRRCGKDRTDYDHHDHDTSTQAAINAAVAGIGGQGGWG